MADMFVHRPEDLAAWVTAKLQSPRRPLYTDANLIQLRESYSPANLAPLQHNHEDLIVIWTLLEMLEEARGWEVQIDG